jgi:hypothetical protein
MRLSHGIAKFKIKQMSKFLKEARHELFLYRKSRRYIYLQQAGEKIYNAYIYLLEALSGEEISSHNQVDRIAKKMYDEKRNEDILKLGDIAGVLHIFFYEGRGSLFFYERNVRKALKLFSEVRRKYRLY